jgi:hypothetical protein
MYSLYSVYCPKKHAVFLSVAQVSLRLCSQTYVAISVNENILVRHTLSGCVVKNACLSYAIRLKEKKSEGEWAEFVWHRTGTGGGSNVGDNEPSGSIKDGEFLD